MRVLLDTHAFLWLVTDDPKLSATAKAVFLEDDNELLLSAVTGFEIAVKYSLGKLSLKEPPGPFIHKRIQANALIPLAITIEHTSSPTSPFIIAILLTACLWRKP